LILKSELVDALNLSGLIGQNPRLPKIFVFLVVQPLSIPLLSELACILNRKNMARTLILPHELLMDITDSLDLLSVALVLLSVIDVLVLPLNELLSTLVLSPDVQVRLPQPSSLKSAQNVQCQDKSRFKRPYNVDESSMSNVFLAQLLLKFLGLKDLLAQFLAGKVQDLSLDITNAVLLKLKLRHVKVFMVNQLFRLNLRHGASV
jgi:hypothetical protein